MARFNTFAVFVNPKSGNMACFWHLVAVFAYSKGGFSGIISRIFKWYVSKQKQKKDSVRILAPDWGSKYLRSQEKF